jgi:hypothetical protein
MSDGYIGLLTLPGVKDDEMTIRGSSGVVVKFLLLSGLILYEKGRYQLAKDIRKYNLIMFGNGLPCESFCNCHDCRIKNRAALLLTMKTLPSNESTGKGIYFQAIYMADGLYAGSSVFSVLWRFCTTNSNHAEVQMH